MFEREPEKDILKSLKGHTVNISPLSIVVYRYLYKVKLPNKHQLMQLGEIHIAELSQVVFDKSLTGPTEDFEDNFQLHSAAEAGCDLFLTKDKKLLNIRYFGKTQAVSSI